MNAPELFKNFEALGVVTPGTPVRVGQTYLVMCVVHVDYGRKGYFHYSPIIPFLHSDPDISEAAKVAHYHLDGRFCMRWPDGVTNGRSLAIYSPKDLVGLDLVERKCLRQQSGLPLVEIGHDKYRDWYASKVGIKCSGKRCPHYGARMIQRKNGLLECPLHGLFADKKTQRIIARSEALARIKPKI